MAEDQISRCFGDAADPLMMSYHDEEWGTPTHDERSLFELLCLEGAQAGLSWRTVLHKRQAYRESCDNFDVLKVSKYDDADVKRLLDNAGIIRNRLKINAMINNANRFLKTQEEFGTFDNYIWQFTGYKTLRASCMLTWDRIPATSPESDAMSKDLKKRGFKFVGSTICYAFMQSIAMVNDHVSTCFRAPK